MLTPLRSPVSFPTARVIVDVCVDWFRTLLPLSQVLGGMADRSYVGWTFMSVVVFHKTTGIPMNPEPLWCFFLMTLIIGILSVEVGYRIGKSRHAFSTAC